MEKTMPKTLLTQRFVEALQYAITAHGGQVRKGTDVTYVAHLLGVASLVLEHGGNEDDAIAGLLHDTIEDCGEHHEAPIRARFGGNVADIVLGLTDSTREEKAAFSSPEEKRKDCKRRKDAYIVQLAHHDDRTLRVSCCDKLYNARAIVSDLHAIGFDVFRRFTGGTEGTLWYYEELARVFGQRKVGPTAELIRTVREMAKLAKDAPR